MEIIKFKTLDEVRDVMLPYMTDLMRCFRDALAVHDQCPPYYRDNVSSRTFFGGIDELTYARAREIYSNNPGVLIGNHKGQDYIQFDEAVALRVKWVDKELRPRNMQTTHHRAWARQSVMDGMGPAFRVDLGYQFDEYRQYMTDAHILFNYGRQRIWVWQVAGLEVPEPAVQQPMGLQVSDVARTFLYETY